VLFVEGGGGGGGQQNPGVGGGLIKKWVSDRVNVGMVDLGHVGGGLD